MARRRENLTKGTVKRIKRAIVAGASVSDVASDHGLPYMTVYKIATGETWPGVEPTGRLIGRRDYATKRVFTLSQCQAMTVKKYKDKLSNAALASRLGASESTVKRAVEAGRYALGFRLHKFMIKGSLKSAQRKLGLSDDVVDELVAIGSGGSVPKWIRKEIEGG